MQFLSDVFGIPVAQIKSAYWIYDDYWKAKRDRWAEDEYVRDEGIVIGLERGKAEGKAEDILYLLESKGVKEVVTEGLVERIRGERNEEDLKRWLAASEDKANNDICFTTV